jgi:hypothetical protein
MDGKVNLRARRDRKVNRGTRRDGKVDRGSWRDGQVDKRDGKADRVAMGGVGRKGRQYGREDHQGRQAARKVAVDAKKGW